LRIDSIPLTGPRHVVPEYGMLIESVPTVALPPIAIEQDVRPGAVALPDAFHVMVVGLVKDPCAVPVSLRSPAHVALNEPRADVGVCSATVHTKLVQVLGDGMIDDEVQDQVQGWRNPTSNSFARVGNTFGTVTLVFPALITTWVACS
jgi:hypothetical protein